MKTVKQLCSSFLIAFSMYSRIPMLPCEWNDENMKYVMCFFPWVGAVTGFLCLLWYRLAGVFFPNAALRTIGIMLIPVFVTGGIHLDGMLDTADALSSWRPREKRIEILKDSHAGAFAIIICVVYFVLLYGADEMITQNMTPLLIGIFFISRSLSAYSVVTFPKMKKEGTVSGFSEKARTRNIQVIMCVYLILTAVFLICYGGVAGAAILGMAAICFWYYHHMAMKNFGGINGDLAGWFVCIAELCMVFGMVLTNRMQLLIG